MDSDMNFIISNRKIKLPKFIKIIFMCLFILIIFLIKCKISLYDIYEARIVKREDGYDVQIFVPVDKQIFMHNAKLLIDNKAYDYKIKDIEDYVSYNNTNYMLVNTIINLDNSYYIDNNYLKIKQIRKKETIFNILLNKLKKGMNL